MKYTNLRLFNRRRHFTAVTVALIILVISACSLKKPYDFPKSNISLNPHINLISPFSEFNEYITLLGRPCNRKANMSEDREYIDSFPFSGIDGDMVIHYSTYGDQYGTFRYASYIEWESRYGERVDVDIFKDLASKADEMFGEEKKGAWQKPSELLADSRYSYTWKNGQYILSMNYSKSDTLSIKWYPILRAHDYEKVAAYMLANYAKTELADDPDNFAILDVRGNIISKDYDPYKLMVELDEYAIAIRLQYDSDNSDKDFDEIYGVVQNINYDFTRDNSEDVGFKVILIGEDAEKYYDESNSETISLEDFGIEYGHLAIFHTDDNVQDEHSNSEKVDSYEAVINGGDFISIGSASQVFVDRITKSVSDKSLKSGFTVKGHLCFYKEGSEDYSFGVDYLNSKASFDNTEIPQSVSFVVFDNLTPVPETMAYFVQCFSEGRNYDDVVQFLTQKQSYQSENEFTVPYCFAMDGVIFEVKKVAGTSYYKIVVNDWGIDYNNNEDPRIPLYFLYKNSDKYILNKIEALDSSKAEEYINYYRNHEEDDLSDYLELEKLADSD